MFPVFILHSGAMGRSSYILSALKGEDKERYVQKCKTISHVDPYNIPRHRFKDLSSLQSDELPDLDYRNVCSYLINFKLYTNKALQSYNSLISSINTLF